MKKVLVLLLALMLIASMTLVAHAAPEPTQEFPNATYSAMQTSEKITIDGVMDKAYQSAEVVKINVNQMIDLLTDPGDIATGEMRILWDSTAVYVFITVNDGTYAPPYADVSWFNNVDSVWVAIGKVDKSDYYSYDIARAGTAYRKMKDTNPDLQYVALNLKNGKEVTMGGYGNAAGNYPANAPKPEGEVDSYTLEIKIPYTGAEVGKSAPFGAFIMDDINFVSVDVINLVDGRHRTSEAVATDNDNGIWQVNGEVDDPSLYFDVLNFVGKSAEPSKTEPVKTEPSKTETVKTEPSKTEPSKTEPAKTEPSKTEPSKTEPAKTEPSKADPTETPTEPEETTTEADQPEETTTEAVETSTQPEQPDETTIPTEANATTAPQGTDDVTSSGSTWKIVLIALGALLIAGGAVVAVLMKKKAK